MTSNASDPRLEAARRIFEERYPRFFVNEVEAYGHDSARVYFETGSGVYHYTVASRDINRALAGGDLVERLKAHGLNAEPVGLNGDVVIRSSAIEALALINALDRLEAMIADREDGRS